jgi:adenine-specific DNA-methyltransferase
MARKQKLELTWIGKENRPQLEPRILLEDPGKSYHAAHRVSDADIFDNRLIYGDNLLALKALEQEFTGKVKCAFIDPPYNTGTAFQHYDDGVEHSLWLSLMGQRIELLMKLLREDGSLWITIDDNECHYLKILCDEIFGRSNFAGHLIWEKVFAVKNSAKYFSASHDHILVYAKEISKWDRNLLPRDPDTQTDYKNPDDDPRGRWNSVSLSARNVYNAGLWGCTTPNGRKIAGPPKGSYWKVSYDKFVELCEDNRIWWGKSGDGIPRRKVFLSEVQSGMVPTTIWSHEEAGNTQEAKREVMNVVPPDAEVFQTPKPERLLQRVLSIATSQGDIVLDSFAGSGTTGAVAQKMGRKWIMVELGDHCHTHLVPRLRKVTDGDDSGGVTATCEWKGGGGFRYYTLAPSLLEQDEFGNWIINKKYNPEMLAEAMCKLEGFIYAPSTDFYWQHGHSTETDFIYVTTQTLTREQLVKLSDEVGPNRSLLICCGAYRIRKLEDFPNLTLKKIPLAVMSKCEWGKDDYSLEIKALPDAPEEECSVFSDSVFSEGDLPKNKRKARKALAEDMPLFGSEEDQ